MRSSSQIPGPLLFVALMLALTVQAVNAMEPYGLGPFSVDFNLGVAVNPATDASIPYALFYPDFKLGPTQPGDTFPIAVLFHGFSLTKQVLMGYGEYLASQGFIVLLPDRNAVSPYTWQVLNMRFMLDWVAAQHTDPDSPLFGRVDASRLGLMGHSQGGKFAFHLAALDHRVQAVVGLDPVDTIIDPSVVPEYMGMVTAPSLLLGTDAPLDVCVDLAQNYEQFYRYAPTPKMMITVLGGAHCQMMTSYPYCPCSETGPNTRTLLIAKWFTAAWFGHFLRRDPSYDPWLWGQPVKDEVSAGSIDVSSEELGPDIPFPTPAVTPLPTPLPPGRPVIFACGYKDTALTGAGGPLTFLALVLGADHVEALAEGEATRITLHRDRASEGVWSVEMEVPATFFPGRFLFAVEANNYQGLSQQWPFLTVTR